MYEGEAGGVDLAGRRSIRLTDQGLRNNPWLAANCNDGRLKRREMKGSLGSEWSECVAGVAKSRKANIPCECSICVYLDLIAEPSLYAFVHDTLGERGLCAVHDGPFPIFLFYHHHL